MRLKSLFLLPQKWTQNCSARDKNGRALDLTLLDRESSEDVKLLSSFSLYGAVAWHFPYETKPEERYGMMTRLSIAIKAHTGKSMYVGEFNNDPDTSFEDIKAVLDIEEELKHKKSHG